MADEEDGIAFVVVRTVRCAETSRPSSYLAKGTLWQESLYIKSRLLRDSINATTGCYFNETQISHQPDGSERRQAEQPYERYEIAQPLLFLYHHREALRTYADDHEPSKPHIEALLSYCDARYRSNFQEADEIFSKGLVNRYHIEKLFVPNKVIITKISGVVAACVLRDWPVLDFGGGIQLHCWYWLPDGSGLTRSAKTVSIFPLEEKTLEIAKLPAIPLWRAHPELQTKLVLRGRKHWDVLNKSHVAYRGWNVQMEEYYPDSRFMIDYQIYKMLHPLAGAFSFEGSPRNQHDPRPAEFMYDTQSSDDLFLLLSPVTYGFDLTNKKWIHLFVDGIQPIKWNKSAFERLVLPSQTKELVKALVTVRTSYRGVKQGLGMAGKREDIISGKGNGLIMLLHGPPGTGKSLTAESLAEIAEMPLFRVTCGDIGTNAEVCEKYLNGVLLLGKGWNCVLLLDEAVVFLEERSMADLQRNSLVAVFLRILEYYDGVLILTSNRVGSFDEAFKSRIQVAFHYETLTKPSRKKIWQNFFDMLEEDDEDVNLEEMRHHLDELAEREMNGRVIRNALTTARKLAIYRKERLDWEHLSQAINPSTDFNRYLKNVQGRTDERWAREERLR